MLTRRSWIVLAAVSFTVVGCAASTEAVDPARTDDVTAKPTAAEDTTLLRALNACTANGAAGARTFDRATFDAGKVLSGLRAEDARHDCAGQRIYSTSRASAVSLFKTFATTDDQAPECFAATLTAAQRARLDAIVSDPDNVGVFASVFDSAGEDAESCAFFNFDVYRRDGQVFELRFDYRD